MSGSPSGLVPRTNNSSLGLGAAGGPRGFAAGVAQVLVNFVANWDGKAMAQIADDLKKNNSAQQLNAQRMAAYQKNAQTAEKSLADIQRAKLAIANTGSAYAQQALKLLAQQTAEQKAYGQATAQTTGQLRTNLANLERQGVINVQQIGLLQNEQRIREAAAAAQTGINDADARDAALLSEKNGLLKEEQSLRSRSSAAASRLGSLTLGVLAGTIGGTLVSGALLTPILAGINATTDALQHMLNPAEADQKAIQSVADAISQIGSQHNLTALQAAKTHLEDIKGVLTPSSQGQGGVDIGLGGDVASRLAEATAINKINTSYDDYTRTVTAAADADSLYNNLLERNRQTLLKYSTTVTEYSDLLGNKVITGTDADIQALQDQAVALTAAQEASAGYKTATELAGEAALAAAEKTAQYIQELQQQSINSSIGNYIGGQVTAANNALYTFKQRATETAAAAADAINNAFDRLTAGVQKSADVQTAVLQRQIQQLELKPSARTTGLEAQIKALSDAGPSKQTQELTDRIDALNKAQQENQYRTSLANIEEQKRQILLAQSLAQTNATIDVDKYQGQEKIIAIDAQIAHQQKLNAAQDNFNKLLDLQYQISQGVRRQQGETIQDFINRRAQYYRGLLQQAQDLRRAGPEADLQAEKARVQQSVQLKDLEAQKRKLIEDHARAQYMQSLQDQLKASQERDRKELESRRETLQKQLDASKKADQDALDAEKTALQQRIDTIRQNATDHIDSLNKQRDADINAVNDARDHAIAAAEQGTAAIIAQLQARAEAAQKWSQFANVASLDEAVKGARSMADLQSLAGSIAGLRWSRDYLWQTGIAQGMDPAALQALMNNYNTTLGDYQNQLNALQNRQDHGFGSVQSTGHFAQGGVFIAGNHNTPVNGDARWGDGNGEELGVILSNKVLHAVKDSRMGGHDGPLIGSVSFVPEDPWRDRARLERMVVEVVRRELG